MLNEEDPDLRVGPVLISESSNATQARLRPHERDASNSTLQIPQALYLGLGDMMFIAFELGVDHTP